MNTSSTNGQTTFNLATALKTLKAKLAEIKAEVRDLKREEQLVGRFRRNRELAIRLSNGDMIAAKILLARRAGKRSAETQRELGWPNLQRAWGSKAEKVAA